MLSLRADHDDEEDRAEPVYAWEGSLETSWLKVKETEEGKLECDALDQVGERKPRQRTEQRRKGWTNPEGGAAASRIARQGWVIQDSMPDAGVDP